VVVLSPPDIIMTVAGMAAAVAGTIVVVTIAAGTVDHIAEDNRAKPAYSKIAVNS